MDDLKFLILIGERIKIIREQKKLSQQDLAALLNYEKSNMSRIEAGRNNMTLKTLYKISKALDVKLKDLFEIEDE